MSGAASLADFIGDPGAWAESGLVAARIAPGLSAETARRLMASPRIGARASRILATQLGSGEASGLCHEDARLVLASPSQLEQIGWTAGAVWHGRRVRALLRGQDIAVLAARFGAELRETALRHAPPETAPPGTDDLANDIAQDGTACIAAWLAELPSWAASRLRLVRPWPHAQAAPAAVAARVALVRLLGADRL